MLVMLLMAKSPSEAIFDIADGSKSASYPCLQRTAQSPDVGCSKYKRVECYMPVCQSYAVRYPDLCSRAVVVLSLN